MKTTTLAAAVAVAKQVSGRLLKPNNLRHLSAVADPPPPPSPPEELTQSAITELLKTTDDWTNNTSLRQQVLSLPPLSLLKLARELQTKTRALQLFHFINSDPSVSPVPLSSAFQAVLELAMREESDSNSIVDLLDLSRELNVSLNPNSAILLIRYFSGVKNVEKSVQVYNELDPDIKNTHVRNVLIGILMKSGRYDEARNLLDEMLEPDAKFPVNEITFRIVFPSLLGRDWKKNDCVEVLALVSRFKEHGVFPDNAWLTRLITKLCRTRNNDKAWDVLHELMKFGKVGVAACNALLSGLGKERNYERINLLLKEMKENDIQPDIVTFGMLVKHLCNCRRVDDALDVLKQIREGNDGLYVKPDVILYNMIIDGLCKVGRQEEGLVLMDKMKMEDGCIPNVRTYNCLIDGFCKSGEIERSLELLDQMEKQGVEPTVITMNILVDGMCKCGRIGSAMELFRQMQDAKGLKGNAATYSALIAAFCNVNNIEKAMELFNEMESEGSPDAIVYYSLISGLTLAGRLDDASMIVSKMKEAGFRLDLVCYNTLIGGFCRKNRLDKAVEILKDMEENGVKADGVTYNTLISHFSQQGDFNTAHKFMKQMIDDGNVPTIVTYGTLIHAYCLAGNLDEAMNIFREMGRASKVPPNTVIYNILINSLCKQGKVENALLLMDEMMKKKVRPNTTTYNGLLKGLCSKNKLKEALRLMDQMTEQACNPDYITMEILTDWLSEVGEIKKLKRFAQGYPVSSRAAASTLIKKAKQKMSKR